MNALLDPIFVYRVLRNTLTDEYRILKFDENKMRKYQNKEFLKVLKFAFSVPVYHDKYKKAGISLNDIRGVQDITKLPVVTKKDFLEGFPDKIISKNFDMEHGHTVSTGGSSGKPVSIYVSWYEILKSYGTSTSEIRSYGYNWKKMKVVNIGNYNPYRADQEFFSKSLDALSFLSITKNYKRIRVETPPKQIVQELDKYKPDFIYTYGGTLLNLANWMRKGFGKNIKPKLLGTCGAILDDYTRQYVEDAFGCKIIDIYACVESGCSIAFQCQKGNYHIHSDFILLEALDDNYKPVEPGQLGRTCITKLYTGGTPIIRYAGLDDWIKLGKKQCDCNVKTPLIDRIQGRVSHNVILPNGAVFPAGAFTFIADVLHDLKTYKVKRFQIVQTRIDKIEISVIIDDTLRDVGPSVKTIFEKIKEVYQKKVGKDVEVTVKEVDDIKGDPKTGKPAPVVVSKVKLKEII